MKNSYCILPVYTGDVSGVCSALYELGGMVVMHDPSGCNSTYNTHDEIRWYSQDSSIYLSGLSHTDAIMGNDKKFIDDVCRAAKEQPLKFIALAGSPIPYLNGTDMPALARIIEKKTGTPCFSVPTNGMHDYVYGAGLALKEIAVRFTGQKEIASVYPKQESDAAEPAKNRTIGFATENQRLKINLLGVTPMDFGPQSQVNVMKANLERLGFEILSCWAMGDTLETLSCAGEAEINLVVSSTGLAAAKVLKEKFGTPFVVGTPVRDYAARISESLKQCGNIKKDEDTEKCPFPDEFFPYIYDRSKGSNSEHIQFDNPGKMPDNQTRHTAAEAFQNKENEVTLIGEPIIMGSLAAAIEQKYHRSARVLCPLDVPEELLAPCDAFVHGEEELEAALKDSGTIIADPLYRPVCPVGCDFHPLPHIAFSGRIYLKEIRALNLWAE